MPLSDLNPSNYKYATNELTKSVSWFEYHTGNIVNYKNIHAIIHQANCFHCMNAGVANALTEKYPEIAIADKQTKRGDKEKLGSYSSCLVKQFQNANDEIIIFNLYSQYLPGSYEDDIKSPDSRENRFRYLELGLRSIAEMISIYNMDSTSNNALRIGVPWMIGCGIAGGDINQTFLLFQSIFSSLYKQIKIIFIDINGELKYANQN